MTCPQCPKRIAKALRKLDGVENVTVSLKTSDAVFRLDSTKTTLPEVIAAIEDIGYKASEKPSGAPLVKLLGHRFTAAVQTAGTVLIAVMGLAMLTQGAGLTGMIPDSVLYAVLIGLALVAVCAALPIKRKAARYGSMLAAAAVAVASGFVLGSAVANAVPEDTAIIADGVQLVSSTLKAGSYPEITVYSGIPVKWTINAPPKSINGCNGTFIVNDLGLQYTFHEGENVIEFTPDGTGVIDYTCWMGMIKGKTHVINEV